jgi:hypothetical protein
MGIEKNVASQKIAIYAHDTSADAAKTGDAGNITAQISLDFGAATATDDTNPTELDATDHPGVYYFNLTQAETNADVIVISAVSSTGNVAIDPIQVFTNDIQQKSSRIIHKTNGTVWFVMVGGDDGNSGLTPTSAKATFKTVVEAASSGDVIVLGPGVHAMGAYGASWSTRLKIVGAGMDLTIITSTVTLSGDNQCIMNPGTGSRLSDFTIEGVGSTYQFPLGCDNSEGHDGVFTDVVCERIRLKADTDGLYFNTCFASPCEITMIDCIIETMYDGIALLTCKDCKITLIRTPVLVTGPSVIGAAGNSAHGVTITGSTGNIVKFIDSPVRTTDGGSTETIGIRINTSGSRVEMYGGSILTEAGEGNVYDVDAEGASDVIVLSGVEYDRSKTSGSGTVTDVSRILTNTTGAVTTDAVSREASKMTAGEARAALGMTEANLDTKLGTLATSSELVGGLFSLNANIDGLIGTIGSPDGETIAEDIAAVPTAVQNRQEMDANSEQFAAIVEDTGTTLPAAISAIETTANVTITPLQSTVSTGEVTEREIVSYQSAAFGPFTWTVTDSDGNTVDLSEKSVSLVVWADGLPNAIAFQISGSVGGDNNNQVTVSQDDTNTGTAGKFGFALMNTTDDTVLARGTLHIKEQPDVP